MKKFFFLVFLFILINTKEPATQKVKKQYKISDIMTLIKRCNTIGYKIIDPDDYIKKDDEQNLEKQLREIYKNHNVVSFIIIFHGAYLKDENNNVIDYTNYTKYIENEIYSQNIVNKKVPIVVAVISIDEKIMSMKAHGSVSNIISQQDCYNILSIVNNYLSYGEYSYGMVELGKLINYYLENTGFFSRNKRFFYMLIVLMLCFLFCYFLSIILQKIRDRRNMRLTMSDEEKLIKIKDFLKKTKANRKILSENCIICLESFDNCVSICHSTLPGNRRHKKMHNKGADEENDNNNINFNINNEIYHNENINNSIDNNVNNDDNNEIINVNNFDGSNSNNLIDTFNETNINTNDDRDAEVEMQTIVNEGIDIDNMPRNSSVTDNQISTLPCGHRYHVKCITEWMLQKKNICPMCREKINVEIPEANEEDLVNELMNIQIELHPAFALLVFQTINEEFTWGAMALPSIHGGLFGGLGGFIFI